MENLPTRQAGKNSRYFKYAIGEIMLVVIGILIALQVSNWNQGRQETKKLYTYYEKLVEELEQEVLITKLQLKDIDSLRMKQTRVLEILNTRDKNDIPELINVLGSVPTSWSSIQTVEIFDEFMSQGFLSKVEDENLKDALRELQDQLLDFKSMDIYVDNQYNTLIEPYFAKNINYSKIALPQYKKTLVQGGPKTDFEALFNSMELWNVATLKLETTNSVLLNLENMNKGLKNLIVALKKNINK
tara:strand:- start:4887 stop:5618 length:732 start_codon:yes stop_codon:yes gene_type:complete